MALNFRTVTRSVLSDFSAEELERIRAPVVANVLKREKETSQLYSYRLTNKATEKLEKAGITLSPFPHLAHSHPVCKTLENYIVFEVIAPYLNNSFTVVGIKDSKLHALKFHSKCPLIQSLNRYVVNKDIARYGSENYFEVAKEKLPSSGILDGSSSINSLVPQILRKIKKKRFFVYDEIFYWSKHELMQFLDMVEPETMYATFIFPPEILNGCSKSLNPWCYEFEIDGDKLHFFPDGQKAEKYTQPLNSGELLLTNRIETPQGRIFSVSVIKSIFSHHVLLISRSNLKVESERYFSDFEATTMPRLNELGGTLKEAMPMNYTQLTKLILFLKTLKKTDIESAQAKYRQIEPEPTTFGIQLVDEIAKMVIMAGRSDGLLSMGIFQAFKNTVLKMMPCMVKRHVDFFKKMNFDSFLEEVAPYYVRVDCRTLRVLSFQPEYINLIRDGKKRVSETENFDYEAFEDTSHMLRERRSSPYSGVGTSCEYLNEESTTIYRIKATLRRLPIIELLLTVHKIYTSRNPLTTTRQFLFRRGFSPAQLQGCDWIKIATTFNEILWQSINSSFIDIETFQILIVMNIRACNRFLESGVAKRKEEIAKISGAFKLIKMETKKREQMTAAFKMWSYIMLFKGRKERIQEKELVGTDEFNVKDRADVGIEAVESEPVIEEGDPYEYVTENEETPDLNLIDGARMLDLDETVFEGRQAIAVAGDGNCFWSSLSVFTGLEQETMRDMTRDYVNHQLKMEADRKEKVLATLAANAWTETETVFSAASALGMTINIKQSFGCQKIEPKSKFFDCEAFIELIENHYSPLIPKNGCVVRAIAACLERGVGEVLQVLARPENRETIDALMQGLGIPDTSLGIIFRVFNICATINYELYSRTFNEEGKIKGFFTIMNDHMLYLGRTLKAKVRVGVFKPEVIPHLSMLVPVENVFSHVPDLERARLLEMAALQGATGKILSATFSKFEWHIIPGAKPEETEVGVACGVFGSGKSTKLLNYLMEHKHMKTLFISPRKKLAEAARKHIGNLRGTAIEIVTFEVAILHSRKGLKNTLVVMDEAQLYPPGYMDLMMLNSKNSKFVLLGDPNQSSYDTDKDRIIFEGVSNDLENLLSEKRYSYFARSYRFTNRLFVGRLPCIIDVGKCEIDEFGYMMHQGIPAFLKSESKPQVVLVPSFEEKTRMEIATKRRIEIMTFGQSTGLSFQRACVMLNAESLKVDNKRWLVALSRTKYDLEFINCLGEKWADIVCEMGCDVLKSFFLKQSDAEVLLQMLPGKASLVDQGESRMIGSDETDREARLAGDPWLKTMLFLGQRENPESDDILLEEQDIDYSKTHLPINSGCLRVNILEKLRAKEEREFRIGDLVTEQFRDSAPLRYKGLSNHAELYESIYPRHKASDTATFLMAVKKRLEFSNPTLEYGKLKKAECIGDILFMKFMERVRLDPRMDHEMMREALNDFEVKKLSKSMAMIENHASRSSADWSITDAFLFMKSQLCTKFDNRFRDAKAGQTLACFSHIVLVRFAPYIRYIEKKLMQALPQNYYIHTGKNFDDLNEWVKKNHFTETCTESDYEAFDSSQDAKIVAFEIKIMRYLQLPEDLIADYIYIKCNLGCKLGPLAIMRFTGEAGTFLFNTMANMVFTFLRYEFNPHASIAFAGDDMCANVELKVSKEYEHILESMKLKAKVNFTADPTFCGWCLSSDGIFKRPQLVYERIQIAKERGNLKDCLNNYALEVWYAYALSDRLYDRMTEEEIENQQGCNREIVKNLHLLDPKVAALFKSEVTHESDPPRTLSQ